MIPFFLLLFFFFYSRFKLRGKGLVVKWLLAHVNKKHGKLRAFK